MQTIHVTQVSFEVDTAVMPDSELINTLSDFFKHKSWQRDIYPFARGINWFFHTDSPMTLVQVQHDLAELYYRIKWFDDVAELTLRFVTERGDLGVHRFMFKQAKEHEQLTTVCSQSPEKIDEGKEEGK